MEFKEFGCKNIKKALLIHGGYVSWRTLQVQIEELKEDFHVFVPLLNGHNINDDSELDAIEFEASEILEYFSKKNISGIHVVYGASLGADIALEILCQSNNFAKYAFIESGSLGINKFATWLLINVSRVTMYYGARGHKIWGKVLNHLLLNMKMPRNLYCDTKSLLRHMSKRTIENVQRTVCNYHLKESISNTTTKCLIVYTSKETMYLKKPYNRMKNMVKNTEIICIDGYNHGQLCIGESKKQISMLKKFLLEN